MKILRNLTVKFKILASVGGVVVIAFCLTIIFVSIYSTNIVREFGIREANQTAIAQAALVEMDLELSLKVTHDVAGIFEGYEDIRESERRSSYISVLKQVLEVNPLLLGIWSVWEPNTLDRRDALNKGEIGSDEKGRFVPGWYRQEKQIELRSFDDYEGDDSVYHAVIQADTDLVTEPRVVLVDGKEITVITLATPVKNEYGKIIGVVGLDISTDTVVKIITKIKPYETGYAALLSNNGVYIAHSNKDRINKQFRETDEFSNSGNDKVDFIAQTVKKGEKLQLEKYSKTGRETVYRIYEPIFIGESKTPWSIVLSIPIDKILESSKWMVAIIALFSIAAMIAVVFVIVAVAKSISDPLVLINRSVDYLSSGNLRNIIDLKRGDELGSLASNFNSLMIKLRDIVRKVQDAAAELSSASEQMSSTSESFTVNAQSQSATSEQITATVVAISAGMEHVTGGAKDQYTSLADLTKKIKSLSSSIKELDRSIDESIHHAEEITGEAKRGEESLREMNTSMTRILESSNAMTTIVGIISDISEQINLLSLNAAIEAARAGDTGRGFAVVADEISKLADQTATSIKQIESLIKINNTEISGGMRKIMSSIEITAGIIDGVGLIGEMINRVSENMKIQISTNEEVNLKIGGVLNLSDQIRNATEEQKIAAVEITRSITNLNELTQSNAAGAEEMSGTSENNAKLAERLKSEMDFFKV